MRAVLQRVSSAKVEINYITKGQINSGLLILLGIEESDTMDDLRWLANKIVGMRIFSDENGLMNLSLLDINGNILLISQFTLFASTQKGNRPSFINAAKPDFAKEMYEQMILELNKLIGKSIETGEFGADMKITLLNDGPVTIVMDTKDKSRH
jgi:D-tyrosyl-tRNA(Tyr) deacylase